VNESGRRIERVRAPGRVNLIGDHTDYTGGLVLPMAIDRTTDIEFRPVPDRIRLTSDTEPDGLDLGLPVDPSDVPDVRPSWGRYVASVAAEMGSTNGFEGRVTTTIPVGAGLSSSAALEVAVALALGAHDPVEVAELCRRAEHRATGVPTGIMDQLCIAAAEEGSAMLIDCSTLEIVPIEVPDHIEVLVRFVTHRTLEGSAYGDRVRQCDAAEAVIGPLRNSTLADLDRLDDPVLRARSRHVITENARVRAVARALADGDAVAAGAVMTDGHHSLRDDFETSTSVMDDAVHELCATPGVYGARMTGGGFGGCVVALCRPGLGLDGWVVRPAAGARRS
jgi:galactokinase